MGYSLYRANWWLLPANAGNSTNACNVNNNGNANNNNTSNANRVAFGFSYYGELYTALASR